MNYLNENMKTEIVDYYDVIVVGAGPAGCGAALASAREGMKTLILDRYNCLGGMWTTGFMNPMFDQKNKDGILAELVQELKNAGQWGGFWNISFNYEYMKYILDCKMKEAGVNVLLNTLFVKTIVEDTTVKGVVVENVSGRCAYMAKMVIDCTGDGAVAANAGCAFEIGEDGDYRTCQAMTLMFLVGNIPEKYREGLMIGKILEEVYEKSGKEIPFHMPYLIPVPNSSFGVVQFTHMYEYNPLSEEDITEATIEGRRQMMECFEGLKKYNSDFKDLELIASSGTLGIRESRRIVGEYTLTVEDLLEGRCFEDSVAKATFNIDIHPKDNMAQKCQIVKPYDIPLRCLMPKGYQGILVAGKCISGTHEAMASYRVTGNCCKMGESAGKRAAEIVKNGQSDEKFA